MRDTYDQTEYNYARIAEPFYEDAMSFEYLASPYSHPEALIRESRYLFTSKFVADCLNASRWVYSPIVHCHELAKTFGLPLEFEYWQLYNTAMLEKASRLLVLRIDGWETSKGVKEEIRLAAALNIPLEYI